MKSLNEGNERLLSDLKHLMGEMEKSFTQINHTHRKFGVDIRAQFTKLEARIATSKEAYQAHEFYELLREYIFTPGVQKAGSRSWYSMTSNVDTLSKYFYLEFFLRTSEGSTRSYDDYINEVLNKPASVSFYTGMDTSDGYRNEILQAARLNRPVLSEKTSQGKLPTVETDIVVEGKVAKLSVDMMGPNMLQDPDFYDALEDRIFDFYSDIADFQHLIFDVRGNPGGYTPFVERMLVGPHLSEPVELSGFVFSRGKQPEHTSGAARTPSILKKNIHAWTSKRWLIRACCRIWIQVMRKY